jgi:8-oxo-dGTP pyrophosphatase MutT (NUDIX family)
MKIIDRKTLWSGRFIKTLLITYRDRKGVVREWEAVGRVNSRGVVIIVPVTPGRELVLIRQYRAALDSYVIELPAGLVDKDEDIIEAGRRELIEETGLIPGRIEPLTDGVMSTGIDTEEWWILIARDVKPAPEEIVRAHPNDENEDIEVLRVPLNELHKGLEDLKNRGNRVDLRIYGLVEIARKVMDT